ncbi:hypothetical protein [Aeromicrobium sp. 179-A 4D2 NHS]|uniref:hypothetical protein n=1 Tax=Aeromicrobium sp. 179-A 4D2 NHS TaxID=3142375 RepID=UPI0039A290E8
MVHDSVVHPDRREHADSLYSVTDEDGWDGENARQRLSTHREWWPVPWINGDHGLRGDFHSFRDDMERAETERLCCVCGDGLGLSVLIGALSGKDETSGGWSHPKCLRLAVTICPHFTRGEPDPDRISGWLWVGDGVGLADAATFSIDEVHPDAVPLTRADIDRLAQADPMGETDLRSLMTVPS